MAPGARDQPGRAAPAQSLTEDGRDLHDITRLRGVHVLAVADVHPDVVDRAPVEDEVAGRQLVLGDVREACVLRSRGVREPHAGRSPCVHGEPRAVERARTDRRVLVGLADLGHRGVHRGLRPPFGAGAGRAGADGVEPLRVEPLAVPAGFFAAASWARFWASARAWPLRPHASAPRSARRDWQCLPARRPAGPAARPARPRSRRGSTRGTTCALRRRPSTSRTRRGPDSSCSLATVRSPMRSWSSSAAAEPYFDRLESSETSPTSSTSAGPPFAAPT